MFACIFILIMSGDQVCKFGIERDLAWLGQIQQRKFVYHVGEPLTLSFVSKVGAPQGVFDRFVSDGGFRGQRHFGEMHQGGSHGEVFGKLVAQIDSHHRFSLHVIDGLVLE